MLKQAYLFVHAFVYDRGFSGEIDWQDSVCLGELEESSFLREYAWVVLASGMREAVVRRKFPDVSQCFYSWESALLIAGDAEACVQSALRVFRHASKIRAVAHTAQLIASVGFPAFKKDLYDRPLETLRRLPFIGPITQFHLAKNIGVDVAKPDRHLTRIAGLFGFSNVHDFCTEVARETGSKVAVVDLVFWRFATLEKNYLGRLLRFATPSVERTQSPEVPGSGLA